MAWLQVKIDSDPERAPLVEAALTDAGAISVTFEDGGDMPLLEPDPGAMPLWAMTRVVALFDDTITRDQIADALAQMGDSEVHAPVFEQVPDREWSRAWMDDWEPLRFGRHLWVAPHDATVDDPMGVVVRLDPGLAFGTGTHATTALCLEWLENQPLTGRSMLDFGCGSGILAIAALRLGLGRAHGIDIDPQAIEASLANARANGVAEHLTAAEGDAPGGGRYDIVVANILAGPLIEAAPALARHQGAGGTLALAGVLTEQADDVIDGFSDHYALQVSGEREGWALITGVRRA